MTTKDDRLDTDLENLEHQYQREAQDQPPAMLDQAILNTARNAVEPVAQRPWSFGWMHTAATAAVIVLGLAVVLQTQRQAPQPEMEQIGSNEFAGSEADSALLNDSPSPALPQRTPVPTAGSAPVADLMSEEQQNVSRDQLEREVMEEARRRSAAADYRLDELEPPQIMPLEAPAAPVASDSDALGPDDASARTEGMRESVPAAEAAAGFNVTEKQMARQKTESDALDDEVGLSVAALRSEQPAEMSDSAASVSPKAWLERIVRLFEANDELRWREELKGFMEAFPDHPVPEEILEAYESESSDP